jgi:hypothetical protein
VVGGYFFFSFVRLIVGSSFHFASLVVGESMCHGKASVTLRRRPEPYFSTIKTRQILIPDITQSGISYPILPNYRYSHIFFTSYTQAYLGAI